MNRIILSILLLSLLSCTKKKPVDHAKLENDKTTRVFQRLDSLLPRQLPGFTRNHDKSYIGTHDSLLYTGTEVYENESEIANVKYKATFTDREASRFYLESKGVDYVQKPIQ